MNRFFRLFIGVSLLAVALSTNLAAAENPTPPSQKNKQSINELGNRVIRLETILEERKGPARLSDERLLDLEKVKSEQATLRERLASENKRLDDRISDFLIYGGLIIALISILAGLSSRRYRSEAKEASRAALQDAERAKKYADESHQIVNEIKLLHSKAGDYTSEMEKSLKEVESRKSESFNDSLKNIGDLASIEENLKLETIDLIKEAVEKRFKEYSAFSDKKAAESELKKIDEPGLPEKTLENQVEKLKKAEQLANEMGIQLPSSHFFNLALTLYFIGEFEKAIENLSKAIELKPDYVEAYYNRGVIYAKVGENDEALKDFNQTIKLKPDYADAYYNRGVIYTKVGENDEALNDYNKAIELKPDYAGAYTNRAELKITQNMFEDAENGLKESVNVFKETKDKLIALYLIRMALAGQEKSDEKEEQEYKGLLAENPDFVLKERDWDFSIIDKFLDEEENKGDIPEDRLKKMREIHEEFRKLKKNS